MAFELRCELHGHQEDVRGSCWLSTPVHRESRLIACPRPPPPPPPQPPQHQHTQQVRQLLVLGEDGAVVTASRDKTAKLWLPEPPSAGGAGDGRGFAEAATFAGHSDYVVALARIAQGSLPPGLPTGPRGALVTGSRDASLRLWRADDGTPLGGGGGGGGDDDKGSGGGGAGGGLRLVGHSYQVTGAGSLPNGDVVSCALDKTIKVWRLPQGKCAATLEGHEGPVLCLAVTPCGAFVLTGSGDGTARLWSPARGGACIAVFAGHTDTVRGVCVIPGGAGAGAPPGSLLRFATASHDCTLRAWTFDAAAAAAASSGGPPARVDASAASAALRGHTAIVYAVASSGDGRLLASGAEDNTVRVWSTPPVGATGEQTTQEGGGCLQVIPHPGCVWDVAFDPRPAVAGAAAAAGGGGGDLFTACSDAVARAFTRDASRAAPEVDREAYAAAVAAHRRAAEAQAAKAEGGGAGGGSGGGDGAAAAADAPIPGLPPGVKVHDPTVLTAPGAKSGDVAVVRESDGAVNAYSWDAAAGAWDKVGEVVAAPSGDGAGGDGGAAAGGGNTIAGGGRKWHAGRQWDFVFDVDVGDGGAMRRLGCDRGENPYLVAERFLDQEELPASSEFREQIVRFVEQNTGGAGGGGGASAFADMPITGGGADPFTGGGGGGGGGGSGGPPRPAYVPPPRPTDVTGGFVDPFTGGGGSGAAAAAGGGGGGGTGAASSSAALPWRTFLLFNEPLAADKVGAKVRELSAALAGGGSAAALTEAEQGAPLDGLLRRAAAATGSAGPAAAASPLPADQAAVLAKMLTWPPASVFPAFDLARCLALERGGAPAVPLGEVGASASSSSAGAALVAVASASPPPAAALTTALRFAANAFFSDAARAWALGQREALLGAFGEALGAAAAAAAAGAPSTSNKASRLALATLLLNYAAALSGGGGSAASNNEEFLAAGMQLVSLADELARALPADGGGEDEAARRAVVAAGTVVAAAAGGGDGDALRDAARAMESLVAAARRLGPGAGAGSGVDAAAVAQARALLGV
jgi:phospholipase A-2-activating protein